MRRVGRRQGWDEESGEGMGMGGRKQGLEKLTPQLLQVQQSVSSQNTSHVI